MLGGGSGSVDHMIKTLRNNKLLLRSKKGFLRRRLTFSELKSYYENRLSLTTEVEARKEVIETIRAKLIKEQRKLAIKRTSIVIAAMMIISIPIFYFFNYRFANDKPAAEYINYEQFESPYSKERIANEMIHLGLKNKEAGDYFLAMGNFENALKKFPNNKEVEFQLAETVCLLCEENKAFCQKARRLINELKEKYPDDDFLLALQSSYL
ncbi:MAG: hypothetical protein CMC96_08820 [Flavobacteriales bacterium]|nr:hypothetical protein [Flavobacteriales bacterium]|tara:strand:+ start:22072 stop:22701 length:630 start_codon:yes stop_codon:yes gene_type:complete